MNRHPKQLTEKAKQCEVSATKRRGVFLVASPSGKEYYVEFYAAGNGNEMRCNCKWSEYHPTKVCAHRLAVMLWLQDAGLRWASFWANGEDAARQHRHTERVQDVWMTTRRETLRGIEWTS